MVKVLFIFLFSSAVWASSNSLENFQAIESENGFSTKVNFDKGVIDLKPSIEFINETIQIDIPNTIVKDGKIQKRIDGSHIRTLLAYQLNSTTSRLRIILAKGIKASQFQSALKVQNTEKGFEVLTDNSLGVDSKDDMNESVITKLENNQTEPAEIDEAKIEAELVALAKVKKSDSEKVEIVSNTAKTESNNKGVLAESEIPVLTGTAVKKAKVGEVSTWRITLGLIVVAMFLVGVWIATNKWLHKKNLKNPQTHIRVLTQHYLGPKKSLAIVSVAGESILIGVTESNITHIKTLSLLDGEISQDLSESDFNSSLKAAEKSGDSEEQIEDYAMKGIKDIVSDRLKGMRNLW